jgi:RNA polymerase sigma-70 factor (ECF subfamily)
VVRGGRTGGALMAGRAVLGEEETSYQQVADRLGLSNACIKTAIHRMRSRYRALVRDEVARTVASPEQVEEELRCLRAALSS